MDVQIYEFTATATSVNWFALRVFKKIKLTSPVPVDFLFKLQYSGHPSLSVVPSSGIIPGQFYIPVFLLKVDTL